MRNLPVSAVLAALAAATLLSATPARAETFHTCTGTIAALPAVISTPGVWCLQADLATGVNSGIAIDIRANGVILDCNGFAVKGLAAGNATQAYGVRANQRQNIVVRNCNVRGFRYGVVLQGTNGYGHRVEDNRFDGVTVNALRIEGDGSVVRRNRIIDTGGASIPLAATAIATLGAIDIDDNTIDGVAPTDTGADANAIGIVARGNEYGAINDNHVRQVLAAGAGLSSGIVTEATSTGIVVRGNHVASVGTGAVCADTATALIGNSFADTVTPISGCADVANLVID